MKNIYVVGGGAAGLAAAVSAARRAAGKGIRVTLFESGPRVGRKILATGNGRCNISNTDIRRRFYHSRNLETVEEIIRGSSETVRAFFKSIGIIFTEEDGRLYPYSRLASSVLDMLRAAADASGVKIITENTVCFPELVFNSECKKRVSDSKVIIATGGLAAPQIGSTGDGLRFLRRTGHNIRPTFPVLTQIKINHPAMPALKGIRVRPCTLTVGGVSCTGEVQFTGYGLSGIPGLNLSGLLNAGGDVRMDFFPEMSGADLELLFENRKNLKFENRYAGLFHKNLAAALVKYKADVKDWVLPSSGVGGYENAQATGGGASLEDFNPGDMGSKILPNLYAAGEVLDAYGDCGGYNLHWAWTTGILAGIGAVKAVEKGF